MIEQPQARSEGLSSIDEVTTNTTTMDEKEDEQCYDISHSLLHEKSNSDTGNV